MELEETLLSDTDTNIDMGQVEGKKLTLVNNNNITISKGETNILLSSYNLNINAKANLGDKTVSSKVKNDTQNNLTIDVNMGDLIL